MLSPEALLQNGRYCVVRLLRNAHNGAVYEVRDTHLGVQLVLKEVLISQPQEQEIFQKQARRLARLHHPSLPTIKDQFIEGNRQYLVMEYIEGTNLGEQLQRQNQPFEVGKVLTVADKLLDLLTYLHSQTPPIIHQEINPHVIKLKTNGQIALQDFGLEKTRDKGSSKAQTWSGHTLGYASPEVIAGKAIDQRSDIYSLGATLYTLLTNNEPVDSRVRQQAIIHKIPDPLWNSQLNGDLPAPLAKLVTSSMALEPGARPANAKIMREMLKKKEVKEVKPAAKSPALSTNGSLFAATSQTEGQRRKRRKRRKQKKESKWPFTLKLKPYQWFVLGLTILLTVGLALGLNFLI